MSDDSTKSNLSDIKRKQKSEFPTKVVIRHLPPTLTQEEFIDQIQAIQPIPDNDYFKYCIADKTLGNFAYNRAYINFKNQDDVLKFSETFDNHVFLDSRGNGYHCLVEFAVYQKIPKPTRKEDSKKNTIENDSDYKKFIENLNSKPAQLHIGLEEMLEEIVLKAKGKESFDRQTTPLIKSLVQKREEKEIHRKRLKEERIRREERERERLLRLKQKKERDKKILLSKVNEDSSSKQLKSHSHPKSADSSKSQETVKSSKNESSKSRSTGFYSKFSESARRQKTNNDYKFKRDKQRIKDKNDRPIREIYTAGGAKDRDKNTKAEEN